MVLVFFAGRSEPAFAASFVVNSVLDAVDGSGGSVVVAPEAAIVEAHVLGPSATGIPASATGTAGLAGLLTIRDQVADAERVAVIFSGVER